MISLLIYILILALVYAIVRIVLKKLALGPDIIWIVDLVFLVVVVIFVINFLLSLAGRPIVVLN